jgi:hypothetical protein
MDVVTSSNEYYAAVWKEVNSMSVVIFSEKAPRYLVFAVKNYPFIEFRRFLAVSFKKKRNSVPYNITAVVVLPNLILVLGSLARAILLTIVIIKVH